jgi:hypothetical protein
MTRAQRRDTAEREWLGPAALIMLSAVPVAAGALRITQLSGGAEITPENARFFAAPVPVLVHILTVSVYSVLGAFHCPGCAAALATPRRRRFVHVELRRCRVCG